MRPQRALVSSRVSRPKSKNWRDGPLQVGFQLNRIQFNIGRRIDTRADGPMRGARRMSKTTLRQLQNRTKALW